MLGPKLFKILSFFLVISSAILWSAYFGIQFLDRELKNKLKIGSISIKIESFKPTYEWFYPQYSLQGIEISTEDFKCSFPELSVFFIGVTVVAEGPEGECSFKIKESAKAVFNKIEASAFFWDLTSVNSGLELDISSKLVQISHADQRMDLDEVSFYYQKDEFHTIDLIAKKLTLNSNELDVKTKKTELILKIDQKNDWRAIKTDASEINFSWTSALNRYWKIKTDKIKGEVFNSSQKSFIDLQQINLKSSVNDKKFLFDAEQSNLTFVKGSSKWWEIGELKIKDGETQFENVDEIQSFIFSSFITKSLFVRDKKNKVFLQNWK